MPNARYSKLYRFQNELTADQRRLLDADVAQIDFAALDAPGLNRQDEKFWRALVETSEPFERVYRWNQNDPAAEQARALGERWIREGKIAAVLLAGGQATRLGEVFPKGMYRLGLEKNESLYEIFIRKIQRLQNRFGAAIPLYVLVSDATRQQTEDFFIENRFFGQPKETVTFFKQDNMPAVDRETGEILLSEKYRVALSPNGHGGVLTAMKKYGILEDMAQRGVDRVCTFQVDNPLIPLADPELIGYSLINQSDIATVVIRKNDPLERVGNMIRHGNRVQVVEYSDLPESCARETLPDGSLKLWMGNIAIHVFRLGFLQSILFDSSFDLPWHNACKKVSFLNEQGSLIIPSAPNAIKKEKFIFDAFPQSKSTVIIEAVREDCFAALKNAPGTGQENAETVRQAMLDYQARYGQI